MTDRLLEKMIKLSVIDETDKELYRFGLETLLLKFIHYMTYLFIAVALQEVIRFFIFFASFLFLRKNAGGYHARTKEACYIGSCLTVLLTILCMKIIPKWSSAGWICGILALAAGIVVGLIAPVENKNRTLDREETKYFRKRTRYFLVIETIIGFVLLWYGNGHYAVAVFLAIVCEAALLLLGKHAEG